MPYNSKRKLNTPIAVPPAIKILLGNFVAKVSRANEHATKAQDITDALLLSIEKAMQTPSHDPALLRGKLAIYTNELMAASALSDEAEVLLDSLRVELQALAKGSLLNGEVVEIENPVFDAISFTREPDGKFIVTTGDFAFPLSARLGDLLALLASAEDGEGKAPQSLDGLVPWKLRDHLRAALGIDERQFASSLNRLKDALLNEGLQPSLIETFGVGAKLSHRLRVKTPGTSNSP